MDVNVKIDLEINVKPEVLLTLKEIFGTKQTAVKITAPILEKPEEVAEVIEQAVEEAVTSKPQRSRASRANKPKAEEPEPVKETAPAEESGPFYEEPEPTPAEEPAPTPEPEKVITIEDARAAATALLKANPANRDKVAAALKACGANKLTEITEPADLKKFVELLEATK